MSKRKQKPQSPQAQQTPSERFVSEPQPNAPWNSRVRDTLGQEPTRSFTGRLSWKAAKRYAKRQNYLYAESTREVEEETSDLSEGDKVRKVKGYKYPGVVVSVFKNTMGDVRYVVECTVEGVEGMLHIFNRDQLEKGEN